MLEKNNQLYFYLFHLTEGAVWGRQRGRAARWNGESKNVERLDGEHEAQMVESVQKSENYADHTSAQRKVSFLHILYSLIFQLLHIFRWRLR